MTCQLNNMTNSEQSLTFNNDRLYSQASTPQPHIYSTLTEPPGKYTEITEEEQLAGYSAISNTATYVTGSTIGSCDDGLYNHTHHGPIAPPTVQGTHTAGYSVATNEEQLASYSVIGDTTTTSKEEIPAGYSVITQDASNDGLVYSAVVRQDGVKTTVKTTAQIDEQQQQSVSDTSNEGLVYSAVVRQDGVKTTVKTTI